MDEYLNNRDSNPSRYSADELTGLFQAQVAAVLTYTAAVARRMGLGLSEIAALEHLQGGELTPTELGKRLRMSSGAVTALVDRLEGVGYVERRPNPRDRRSSVVRVTRTGVKEAARHLGPLAEELLGVAAGLSEGDRAAAGRYVEGVTAAIERHAREDR